MDYISPLPSHILIQISQCLCFPCSNNNNENNNKNNSNENNGTLIIHVKYFLSFFSTNNYLYKLLASNNEIWKFIMFLHNDQRKFLPNFLSSWKNLYQIIYNVNWKSYVEPKVQYFFVSIFFCTYNIMYLLITLTD